MKKLATARRLAYGMNANSFINPNASNKSLDRSRGSVFRFQLGAAKVG